MRVRLAFVMLVCLVLAGCAQGASTSNDDSNRSNRFGGFYGGISGGGME